MRRVALYWIGGTTPLRRSWAGGKATGLDELSRLGANVPMAFVMPHDANRTRAATAVEHAVRRMIKEVGAETRFAVRSSATVEDGAEASYAGMFSSFLNVAPEDVLSAIAECDASVTSKRIDSYRETTTEEAVGMAVVVQCMVKATESGTCFTVNPVTGNRDELVIEATRGLGEPLAQGEITPDYFCLRHDTGEVIHSETQPDSGSEELALSDQKVRAIWQEAKRLHDQMGESLDLEFAFDGDVLYVLQMRSVTAVGQA